MTRFHETYRRLLVDLLDNGEEEMNMRTGRGVKSAAGGVSFKLDLSDGCLPVCGVRRTFPATAAAETAWYLRGEQSVFWLRDVAGVHIWDKFLEADGETVAACYGHRWRRHFGRDQIAMAINALRKNPSDRRVLVAAWDAAADGLGQPSKNVPCPTHFSFSVVDGALHSSLFLRSSDVFVGLPYDVMGHALLMDAMARSIDVRLGTMHATLAHAHVYAVHYGMAEMALDKPCIAVRPAMPGWSVDQVECEPLEYVGVVREAGRTIPWPEYNPKPELVA